MSTPITYESVLWERYRTAFDWTPEGSQRVLDVGCGNAIFTQWLRAKAVQVCGFDHNLGQVAYGHRRYPDLLLFVGAGEAVPLRDESFDGVICSEVLEHVDNDQSTLDEIHRLLRPGGWLILTTPHAGLFAWLDGENVVNGAFEFVRRLRLPKPGGGRLLDRFRFRAHRHYTLEQIEALLRGRFAIERTYRGGFFLYPVLYLVEKCLESFAGVSLVEADYRRLRRLRDLDYHCACGRWAYNLAILARKTGGS